MGLISYVIDGPVVPTALVIAERVASRSPRAVQETKRLLGYSQRKSVQEQMNEEGRVFGELVKSDYCRALFARFLGR